VNQKNENQIWCRKKPKDTKIVRKKQSKKLFQTKQIPIKKIGTTFERWKKIKGSKIEKKRLNFIN